MTAFLYLALLFISGMAVQLAPVGGLLLAGVEAAWGAALYFGLGYWMMKVTKNVQHLPTTD